MYMSEKLAGGGSLSGLILTVPPEIFMKGTSPGASNVECILSRISL